MVVHAIQVSNSKCFELFFSFLLSVVELISQSSLRKLEHILRKDRFRSQCFKFLLATGFLNHRLLKPLISEPCIKVIAHHV